MSESDGVSLTLAWCGKTCHYDVGGMSSRGRGLHLGLALVSTMKKNGHIGI